MEGTIAVTADDPPWLHIAAEGAASLSEDWAAAAENDLAARQHGTRRALGA
jgi:hypothetical protein